MNNKCLSIMTASLLTLALVGCTNQEFGTTGGAVLGGIAGSQVGGGTGKIAATIGGALIGGFIGGQIGQSMDEVDRMKMNKAMESARTGQPTSWTNPDTRTTYAVTPTRTYDASSGQPCREFQLDATIAGQSGQQLYGTACRDAQGNWKVVK